MSSQETTQFLKNIDRAPVVGLRDRALIGVMVYSFPRVSAVVSLKVEDYFPLGLSVSRIIWNAAETSTSQAHGRSLESQNDGTLRPAPR
jgi:site-specific recombinase XerC